MRKAFACLVFVCVAAPLFSACSSTPPAQWSEGSVEAKNDDILWKVTVLSLEKMGFPVGSGLERDKLRAVSGWKTQPAPFKGEGFRERCEINYKAIDARRYEVKVRVERERNNDIIHPLDLSYAQWEPDPDNVEKANIVLRYIKALLGAEFEMKKDEGKKSLDKSAQSMAPKKPVE